MLYSVSHDRCHGSNIHKCSIASTVPAAKPLMRVRKTVYDILKELDIYLATPTHRGTAGGCRRFNNAIPVRVTTARNDIIRPSAQTIVNKSNLICFPSRIGEPLHGV